MRYLIIFLLLISSAKAQIPAGVFNQGSDDAMIVEVRVAGNASGRTAYIYPNGATDINVDWGDGTSDYYNTAGQKQHLYSSAGTFMIEITGSLQGYGSTGTTGKDKVYAIHSWGDLGLTSLGNGCQSMVNIEYVAKPPAAVTNMISMFNNATNFNGDISGWDVSNVTSMAGMFQGASSFNGDISGWDVSNVIAMANMFYGATSFNQDLSGWCVINIPAAPFNFSVNTPAWTLPKPVWGTCP